MGKFSDLQITADDFSYLLLEFKNKILGNVHLNFFQKPPSRFCKIIGTDGIIHCNLLTNNIVARDAISMFTKLFATRIPPIVFSI